MPYHHGRLLWRMLPAGPSSVQRQVPEDEHPCPDKQPETERGDPGVPRAGEALAAAPLRRISPGLCAVPVLLQGMGCPCNPGLPPGAGGDDLCLLHRRGGLGHLLHPPKGEGDIQGAEPVPAAAVLLQAEDPAVHPGHPDLPVRPGPAGLRHRPDVQ